MANKNNNGSLFTLENDSNKDAEATKKTNKHDKAISNAYKEKLQNLNKQVTKELEETFNVFLDDLKLLYGIERQTRHEATEAELKTEEAKNYISLIANKAKPETALSEMFKEIINNSKYLDLKIDPQIKAHTGWVDYLITDRASGNPIAIELKPMHVLKGDRIVRQRLDHDYDLLKKEFEKDGSNQVTNYLKDFEYVVLTNMEDVFFFNKEANFNNFGYFHKESFISFAKEIKDAGGLIWDTVKRKEDITPRHDLDKHFFQDLKKWYGEFENVKFDTSIKKEEKIVLILNKFMFLRTLEDYSLIPYNHTINTYDISEKKWKTKGYAKVFDDFFSDIQQWAYLYYDTEMFKDNAMNYVIQDKKNIDLFRTAFEKVFGVGQWDRTFGMGLLHYNYRKIDEDIFGKTYEIFLAEQRKEKGIHYTPAFITSTMSENIINELFATLRDQLLKEISEQNFAAAEVTAKKIITLKILDPACGSGSFLVKLLRKIWDIYRSISNFGDIKWANNILIEDPEDVVQRKKTIKGIINLMGFNDTKKLISLIMLRHLYGIDLDAKAISVAKANLWKEAVKLSPNSYRYSVLTEDLNHILPDLETNLICADSLVDFPTERAIELLAPYAEDIAKMHELRNRYFSDPFNLNGIEELIAINNDIREKLSKIFAEEYGTPGEPPLLAPLSFFFCYFDENGNPRDINQQGFNGIIGNPPYNVFVENEYFKGQEAKGTGNLFGHFIIKAVDLCATGGAFSFIVPLSFASGKDYENVRQKVYNNYGFFNASHYSIRPTKLFQGVDQRMTIFFATKKGDNPCLVKSSRLYRYTEVEREEIVRNPVMGNAGYIKSGFIPRVSDDVGASIYKKFLSIKSKIADYMPTEDDLKGLYAI